VVDPLGRPLDGQGPIEGEAYRPLHHPGYRLHEVQPTTRPLPTGIKVLDVLFPLSRGATRLLVGPIHTGKTTLALGALQFQRTTGVLGIYVAVGQRREQIAGLVEWLRREDTNENVIVVATTADDPLALQMLAPSAGFALAEFFACTQGRDVLCVHDDLNHLASACRSLLQLLGSSPLPSGELPEVVGLVSGLLDRSAALAERWVLVPTGTLSGQIRDDSGVNRGPDGKLLVYVGPVEKARAEQHDLPRFPGNQLMRVRNSGGSVTAIGILEAAPEHKPAFLPVGPLSSLTTGLWVVDADRFRSGARPALDLHRSIGGRGGQTLRVLRWVQDTLLKSLWGAEELERFAQLPDLDAASRRHLERNRRLLKLLDQPAGTLLTPEEQAVSLCAGLLGFLDRVPLEEVSAFEARLLAFCREQPSIFRLLAEVRNPYDHQWREAFEKAIRPFPAG
jgi:F-type H+-transporting ATPase subunit alpha